MRLIQPQSMPSFTQRNRKNFTKPFVCFAFPTLRIFAVKSYCIQVLAFITLLLITYKAQAQDLHFTQYTNAPLLVNPANTGANTFYDFRVGGNIRNQWAATQVPYKTVSVWGDAKLFENRLTNSWLGVGAILLNDVAGTGSLTSTKAFANITYHTMLDEEQVLSVGISGGLVQKRVDYTKLTFDAQWNEKFFDITAPSNEPFIANQASYLDFNMGMNYSWYANDNFYFNAGLSMMHVLTPKETFFNTDSVDARVPRRYNAFFNATIKMNDAVILNPTLYYSQMATSSEFVLGCIGNINLSGDGGNTQLLLGAYYRNKNAIAPAFGFVLGNLQIMANYDATTSTLTAYQNFRSAYELSIVWNSMYKTNDNGAKAVRCTTPRF